MTNNRFSQSDRRAILLLMGVMVVTTLIIAFHKPQRAGSHYYRDTMQVYQKHQDSLRRAARYQAVRDSYAQLRAEREQRKQEREARYQAMRDSFAQLKAERQAAKAQREAQWAAQQAEWAAQKAERERRRDSIQALRPKKLLPGETIDPNTSDTLQLQQVPGIGRYYAQAIVRYRERLGGFYQSAQMLEIQGFPEQALPYFHIEGTQLQLIDLNRDSFSRLRSHPYLSFAQVKAIMDYRQKYGRIASLQQLSLLEVFSSADLLRLEPYLAPLDSGKTTR